jgi:hypothetical protein
MYQDVKNILHRGHKKVANNTCLTLEEDRFMDTENIVMRLHGNIVAIFYLDHIQLYSAGWYTTTTKNRLNMALNLANITNSVRFGSPLRHIYQVGYQWYYGNYHKGDTKFAGSMCINYEGKVIGGK